MTNSRDTKETAASVAFMATRVVSAGRGTRVRDLRIIETAAKTSTEVDRTQIRTVLVYAICANRRVTRCRIVPTAISEEQIKSTCLTTKSF